MIPITRHTRSRARLLFSLAALLYFLAAAAPAQRSTDASVGTWPFLVGNMDSRIQTMVDTTVNNGLDTIYVNAFRATGFRTGTLWITDAAGWNPAWGAVRPGGTGIDLVKLINAAHLKGLQVVAVIKCFDSTVAPTNASHRQYLLDVIDYLVDSYDATGKPVYDLDGVALDYVRFVGGSSNNPAPVTSFVSDVRKVLGVLTLHAYLPAGRYTLDGPVYDTVFNSYASVISQNASQYGQHWEQLAQYVDVMMPMTYTANGNIYSTYTAHQAYVRTATQYVRTACQRGGFPNRRVVSAVRCWSDSNETATTQTIDASVTGALLGGGTGYQAFRYGTMQSAWWSALRMHAVPGPNRPLPFANVSTAGMGHRLDATGSRDFDEPSARLRVRFDWESDGRFDTVLSTQQRQQWVARNPGTWRIGMEVRDSTGLSGFTTRRVNAINPLVAAPTVISARLGGAVQLKIASGVDTAGAGYVLSGTLSGTTPGTQLAPGFNLPLNFDAITWLLVSAANTPLFPNAIGSLDATGQARATFSAPPGLLTPVIGLTVHFAGATIGPGGFVYVTNAEPVTIWP